MSRLLTGAYAGMGDRLFLNLFAILGAVLGLLNAAMAWHIFGTGSTADTWMMALAATQAFALLSQIGVEQIAVFSAEARATGEERGRLFDRHAMAWSLWFGVAFGALAWLCLPLAVSAFARGFDEPARLQVQAAMAPLVAQLAVAPALHVLRQQLLLDGRPKPAILLNNVFGLVQCIVLLSAWGLTDASPLHAAWALGLGSLLAAGGALLLLRDGYRSLMVPNLQLLAPFVRASVALRFTHSIHNFLVVLLTGYALSGGVSGTVATFQYVKKVADGLASISIGPHLVVYHAAQASAWMNGSRQKFLQNIRLYLYASMPLLLAVVSILMLALYTGEGYLAMPQLQSLTRHTPLLLVLIAWQVLIALETIPVGVLVIERRPLAMLIVNGLYIAAFFAAVNLILPRPYAGVSVATASLACQLLSSMMFALLAFRFFKLKFRGQLA